jgi:hypothetical protein
MSRLGLGGLVAGPGSGLGVGFVPGKVFSGGAGSASGTASSGRLALKEFVVGLEG